MPEGGAGDDVEIDGKGKRLVAHVRAMAEGASSDESLLGLGGANAVALAIAAYTSMTLSEVMLVYWIQSVIIGAGNVIRIVSLHRYTKAIVGKNPPVEPMPIFRFGYAAFFALHYGFFHLAYFSFIASKGGIGPLGPYVGCGLAFLASHAFSLRRNLARDAAGCPSIGILAFMPYARILPMHLVIISGVAASGATGTSGVLVFGALKTAADMLMHAVEHHVMAKRSANPETIELEVP